MEILFARNRVFPYGLLTVLSGHRNRPGLGPKVPPRGL
jgi:hypothetical protein